MAKLVWEQLERDPQDMGIGLDPRAERARVPGGWLVRVWKVSMGEFSDCCMAFVPDPNHEWE
jgi:hypothetical protein